MRVALFFFILLSLAFTGCAGRHAPAPTTAPTTPAVVPQPSATKPTIAPNAIALDLDPQSCVCHLGQVDVALLSLPNVWRLDWDTAIFRVTMLFRDADAPRPTDRQITEAMGATDVKLKAIHRP